MKKILLLGGKRVLGSEIAKQLSLENKITCITRNPSSKKNPKVEYIQGDIENINILNKISKKKYDVLIDNISYGEKHVDNIYNFFKQSNPKYIMTSSYWVTKERFIKEMPPLTKEYVRGKIKAEKKARGLWEDIVIARLPILFGKEDHTRRLRNALQQIKNKNIYLSKKRIEFQIGNVEDISRIYELFCSSKDKKNITLEIANPEIYTQEKFYKMCAETIKIPWEEITKHYNSRESDLLFREFDHTVDLKKLNNLFPYFKFSENWLKKLCLYEIDNK